MFFVASSRCRSGPWGSSVGVHVDASPLLVVCCWPCLFVVVALVVIFLNLTGWASRL